MVPQHVLHLLFIIHENKTTVPGNAQAGELGGGGQSVWQARELVPAQVQALQACRQK